MATYWAIAIGINQYRCFQPLMYAQRDAQALWSYWVSEGQFPPEQCLLLTDASSAIDQTTSDLNRDTLQDVIQSVCDRLQADDVLWCFFSGYGVRFQGRDYLMPIDGDPRQVAATGISVESLFATLRSAPTDNIVLALDINRSQGVLDGEGVGQEVATLATQFGIPTLLSCPSHQFSHETLALRQGLFTAAILEGLRFQGCATIGQLARYVSDRLPELSEHHCRPRQDALAIVPPAKQHLLVVPQQALVMAGVPYGYSSSESSGSREGGGSADYPYLHGGGVVSADSSIQDGSIQHGSIQHGSQGNGSQGNGNGTATPEPPLIVDPALKLDPESQAADESDTLFWRRWTPWLLGAIALLVGAVLLQNRDTFSNEPLSEPSPTASSASPSPGNTTENSNSPLSEGSDLTAQTFNPEADVVGESPVSDGELSEGAIADPESSPQPDPLTTTGEATPGPSTGDGSNLSEPSVTELPVTGLSPTSSAPDPNSATPNPALRSVRTALQARQYEEAARQLDRVPAAQRTGDYAALLQQTNQGLLLRARASLSRPRALSATNQASDFSTAIQLASRIKQGQPFYPEAQQDVDRWSQIILELARSRASQPNQGSALVAAQNYSAAIRAAGLVPANRTQLHTTAQQYAAQWSQTILNIARARAREGRLDVAVRTAQLVPNNTPSYAAAQEAIAQWQTQLYY